MPRREVCIPTSSKAGSIARRQRPNQQRTSALKLVIVESPAKAQTIGKFLGKDYKVVASYGHIRDLPKSAEEIPEEFKSQPWARLAVDVDNGFRAVYVVQKESKKNLAELKKLCKEAEEVILATDEDREGESISWHLLEVLKPKVAVSRIAFHEITKTAIEQAVASPRQVNDQLVRAQETRRILDRLFGYELSPVLWKRVRTGLSAGRVQSVAVRLVVEREEERRAFHRAEYWDVEAKLCAQGKEFTAELVSLDDKRVAEGKDFDAATGRLKSPGGERVAWLDRAAAEELARTALGAVPWRVVSVDQKETRQRPQPPFITSTLQQAASSAYGFSPRRTMEIAQRLYEGVDLGEGEREGLITYMRTDSVVLSERALAEAGEVIANLFGSRYHSRRQYTTKSRMAQEAHEAIRPTHLARRPESVANCLNPDELKLYRLVWNRAVASQMADAELLKTTADIEANAAGKRALFRAAGQVITFAGFLRVMESQTKETELPPITEGMPVGPGQPIALSAVDPVQHETQPPARFTEASLVRRLEEEGIGRPSTYAPTISIIQQRGYVERMGQALAPSFLGIAVTILLRGHFAEYVDVGFTAKMEEGLDEIAEGTRELLEFLTRFYHGAPGKPDEKGLKPRIAAEMELIEYPAIPVGDTPEGEPLIVRLGRSAPFLQRGEGGEGNVVSIPKGLYYDELSVEKAMELLAASSKAAEGLGNDPSTGLPVFAFIGPYGPYVQLGVTGPAKSPKPKRASLPKGTPVEDVTLATALKYLSMPRTLGAHPEKGKPVVVNLGRFGPYVGCDGEFRSLEKGEDVFGVTFERAITLLNQPKPSGAKKLLKNLGNAPGTETPIDVYEGRYGPYVTNGAVNATLPKTLADPTQVTMEEALALLVIAAEKKPGRPFKRRAAPFKKAAASDSAAPKKKAAAKKKPAAKKKASAKKKAAAKKKPRA